MTSPALPTSSPPGAETEPDQCVVLHGVSWADYERILEIRGEGSGVRIAYLDGELELMSTGYTHGDIKRPSPAWWRCTSWPATSTCRGSGRGR